jgi:hypothetical protein
VYFLGGNALLHLHRLSDGKVVREVDLLDEGGGSSSSSKPKGGGGGGGKDDESVASGSTAQQQANSGGGGGGGGSSSSSSKKQENRLGMCVFGEGGASLFAVAGNRRVLKLEAGTLKELKRSVH